MSRVQVSIPTVAIPTNRILTAPILTLTNITVVKIMQWFWCTGAKDIINHNPISWWYR